MDPIEQIHKALVSEELIADARFEEEVRAVYAMFPEEDDRDSTAVWRHGVFTFKNGAELSVIKGGGAYSSPGTVEIAFFEGSEFSEKFEDEWGDQVIGYQTPDQVIEWVHKFLGSEKKIGADGELT